jgi:pimeloyl-ACP methyl ester carboxylesterase
MRSWLKEKTYSNRDQAQRQGRGSVADGHRMSPAMQHRTAAGTRRLPSNLSKSTAIETTIDGFTYLDPTPFHEYFAAEFPVEQAAFMARSQVFYPTNNFKRVITTPALRSKPSWMAVATEDRTIKPDLERWYAKRVRSHTVAVASASHSIYVSRPRRLLLSSKKLHRVLGRKSCNASY